MRVKKKVIDHIIWILITSHLIGTAVYAIVSEICSTADTISLPWWVSAALLWLMLAPKIAVIIEALLTYRSISEERKRSKTEKTLNMASVILAAVLAILSISDGFSIISIVLFAVWVSVRIISRVFLEKDSHRTKVSGSPVFRASVAVIVLIVGVIAALTADRGKPDPEPTLPTDFSSKTVLEAWTGGFDEEKLKTTIAEYDEIGVPFVSDYEDNGAEPFFLVLDYYASAVNVVRLAAVDEENPDHELTSYIDMKPKAEIYSNIIEIDLSWWFTEAEFSWTVDYPMWSYLVSVTDADGEAHYYYFRVKYEKASDSQVANGELARFNEADIIEVNKDDFAISLSFESSSYILVSRTLRTNILKISA